MHAVDIFRTGLKADQDHVLAGTGTVLGLVGVENHHAAGGARRSGETSCQHVAWRIRVESRMQQSLKGVGINPPDSLDLVDQALFRHLHGDLKCRRGSALSRPRLQYIEAPLLHGKLDVLHIGKMAFQEFEDSVEFGIDLGHGRLHGDALAAVSCGHCQWLRRADTSDHVFTLGVDEILAEHRFLTSGRIAGEGNSCGAVVAHIAEHHALDVDGSAPMPRDIVQAPIGDGTLVHPAAEDCDDGAPELILWPLRERLTEL